MPVFRSAGALLSRLHALPVTTAERERSPLMAGEGDGPGRALGRARGTLATCLDRGFLTAAEALETGRRLEAWRPPPGSSRLSFVHGDFQLNNLLVSATAPDQIVGLLDFSGSHFGHPEEDLPRLLCTSLDLDLSQALAEAVLDGYGDQSSALPFFLLCERLDLWKFIKDLRVDWVDQSLGFTDWLAPYLTVALRWSSSPRR
ncbi:phosphotransferase family protein [Deinococcus sp.]|uniref:phosphotransferase family protein n=1 Tax=Deinococcus sp. TaxID=47478 RepID=UPI003C7C1F5F